MKQINQDEQKSLQCPSSMATPGAGLLGVRQEDGTIAILPQVLPVDETFIQIGQMDPVPLEQRFRFTNACIEKGCKQWNGKSCGVAKRVVRHMEKVNTSNDLPPCGIRSSCRWYAQEGNNACKICSFVVTEITNEESEIYLTEIKKIKSS